MKTSKIKLVYKQRGGWDYSSHHDCGCVYDTWACRYALDIDKTIEANSNINRDVLVDYIDNNIADGIVVYTDDISEEAVAEHCDDLGGLDWLNYDYYTYLDEIYYWDNINSRHNVIWVDTDDNIVTVDVDMT